MEVITTPLQGLFIIKPRVFPDDRGYFFESYHREKLKEAGIDTVFVQDNQSCSKKGVIRGLHFQKPPYAQAKLVRVLRGSALDVAVDLRKGSPTYGKSHSVILTGENHLQFYLPVGFAHGFSSLEENTLVAYKCSNFYHKESEGTIRYDDPDLHIDWQVKDPVVNQKDLEADFFSNFFSCFHYEEADHF